MTNYSTTERGIRKLCAQNGCKAIKNGASWTVVDAVYENSLVAFDLTSEQVRNLFV